MNTFIKFPDIENSYNTKHITHWLERYPDLQHCKFVYEEKIDGSNLSIITKPKEVFFASRNQIIRRPSSIQWS